MQRGGGQHRQAQRAPETQLLATAALAFIEERFGNFIQRVQSINVRRAPASSVNSKSHPSHNIFFDSFRVFGMVICKKIPNNNQTLIFPSETSDDETTKVPSFSENCLGSQFFDNKILLPTFEWAQAFIEEDLKSITEKLWHGIYYCISNPFSNLSENIRDYGIYIERVALWMADKKKDPFSFNYKTQIFQSPTPKQRLDLDAGRDDFLQRLEENENLAQQAFADVGGDLFNILFVQPAQEADFGNLNELLEDLEEAAVIPEDEMKARYAQIFKEFVSIIQHRNVAWGLNPARIATALTRAVIPLNTDIRVDCVPFSNNRWTAAAGRQFDLAQLSEKLFNTHFVNDFIEPKPRVLYEGLHSICPFKRLAIYRGSMFLWKVWRGEIAAAGTCDFNSEIDNHNVWPNTAERQQIELGLANSVENKSKEYGLYVEIIQNPVDLRALAGPAEQIYIANIWDGQQPQLATAHAISAVNKLPANNVIQPQAEIVAEQSPQAVVGINAVNWDALNAITEFIVAPEILTETRRRHKIAGLTPAAKYLFEEMFTTEEKRYCNLKGNRGFMAFNKIKIRVYFETIVRMDLKEEEWKFDEDHQLVKDYKRKIFTEYQTQRHRGNAATLN